MSLLVFIKANPFKTLFFSIYLFFFLFVLFPTKQTELEIKVESFRDSVFTVFWNGGRASVAYPDKGGVLRLKLGDLNHIQSVNIRPTEKSTTVYLGKIAIRQIGYKSIYFDLASDFKKFTIIKNVETLSLINDSLKITTTSRDSLLAIDLHQIRKYGFSQKRFLISIASYFATVIILSIFFVWLGTFIIKYLRSWLIIAEGVNVPSNGTSAPQKNLPIEKWVNISLAIFVATVLFILSVKCKNVFSSNNIFGTGSAPYSDAFMWLRGTIHYINDLPFKTYRPTINLFFGSIYSLNGRINSIPLFSIGFFGLNIFLIYIFGLRPGRMFLLILLVLLSLFFDHLVLPLNPGQIMMDFPPFSFTCVGVFLVAYALKCIKVQTSVLFLGLVLIGTAAAIRGIQLGGGLIILLYVLVVCRKRISKINLLGTIVFFLFPIILDVYLQKKYGAINNGLFSVFCFYNDSSHSYSRAGKELFKHLQLSGSEVLSGYVMFLCSWEGMRVLFSFLSDILSDGLNILQTKSYYSLLAVSGTCMVFRSIQFVGLPEKSNENTGLFDLKTLRGQRFALTVLQTVLHCLIVPLLIWYFVDYATWILGVYLLFVLLVSSASGLYLTTVCLAMYVGGGMLFAMLGMPGKERVLASFAFTLPLGYLLFLVEDIRQVSNSPTKGLGFLVVVNMVILLFLYCGSMILPLGKNGFLLDKNTIIKISQDLKIDRSLYYSDEGKIFYTHYDDYRIGTRRYYTTIHCSHGDFNPSFINPCLVE